MRELTAAEIDFAITLWRAQDPGGEGAYLRSLTMARELLRLRERIAKLQHAINLSQRDSSLPNKDGKDVYDIGVKVGALLTGASHG